VCSVSYDNRLNFSILVVMWILLIFLLDAADDVWEDVDNGEDWNKDVGTK